jgi:hypothetical protein
MRPEERGRPVGIPREQKGYKIGESGHDIHEAKARHRPTYEVVRRDDMDDRNRFREIVARPEHGPRHDDEDKTNFEEERDEQEPPHVSFNPSCQRARAV